METNTLRIFHLAILCSLVLLAIPLSHGYTYEEDVYAINSLYTSLGSPPIPGWIANGGDPCLSKDWQGVLCAGSNIASIILNAANLGGQLGDKLGNFTSITTIDLSNNNIGGSIPENLPHSMSNFFLSANMFTGSIPSTLSELSNLTAMSVNENHLTGELPDAFQSLIGLINLDLSSNNITGPLPPSMANLSLLTTLHIQNNQLTGTLDVLQDLPLKNLNVENNQFSGPIPQKMLNIPIFLKDGNPFNTSIAPSPASLPPPSPGSEAPAPGKAPANSSGSPGNPSDGQSTPSNSPKRRKGKISALVVVGLVAVAAVVFAIIVLLFLFCKSKYRERSENEISDSRRERIHTRPVEPIIYRDTNPKREDVAQRREAAPTMAKEPKSKESLIKSDGVPKEMLAEEHEHEIETNGEDIVALPPVPGKVTAKPRRSNEDIKMAPSNLPTAGENVSAGPGVSNQDIPRTHIDVGPPTSVTSFSVASLQQYTDGFREEKLILDARVGKVYLGELPGKKRIAILKIDIANPTMSVDAFLELVLSVSELQHRKVTRLIGYCAEYEQQLLVYDYFSSRTLQDVLHGGDDLNRLLSWNARIKVSLEAAQALEYLHEKCQPPVVHRNFNPSCVLIDDKLAVCVSDCGLASLTQTHSVVQLSGRIRSLFSYEAPEVNDGGAHTEQSDVYSFGVVMLEILTGRVPYDSARPRAEQHLARWARSHLHDIDALSRMVDPSIEGRCPEKSLSRFADIISGCIQPEPEFRPPMSQVVQDLSHILEEATSRGKRGPV